MFTNSTKTILTAKAKFSNDSKEKRLKKDWKTTVLSFIILERFCGKLIREERKKLDEIKD